MAPDEPSQCNQQRHADDGVKSVEVLAEFSPVFSKLHAEIGQSQAPWP